MTADAKKSWTRCDSRSDMEARLEGASGQVAGKIVTEAARSWGILTIGKLLVPVGFADIGLKPDCIRLDDTVLIGISELLVGIKTNNAKEIFRYQMPTVFHAFVHANDKGILVNDEIGFVYLSLDGKEKWKFCKDIIDSYSFSDGTISGVTLEGEHFEIAVPGFE